MTSGCGVNPVPQTPHVATLPYVVLPREGQEGLDPHYAASHTGSEPARTMVSSRGLLAFYTNIDGSKNHGKTSTFQSTCNYGTFSKPSVLHFFFGPAHKKSREEVLESLSQLENKHNLSNTEATKQLRTSFETVGLKFDARRNPTSKPPGLQNSAEQDRKSAHFYVGKRLEKTAIFNIV